MTLQATLLICHVPSQTYGYVRYFVHPALLSISLLRYSGHGDITKVRGCTFPGKKARQYLNQLYHVKLIYATVADKIRYDIKTSDRNRGVYLCLAKMIFNFRNYFLKYS